MRMLSQLKQFLKNRRVEKKIRTRKPDAGLVSKRLFSVFNRYLAILLGMICAYIALLLLLVHAEKHAPGATIHNIGEAIWYSLATFTTVGYGDLYPVTPAGRAIASIFLVLGIGLLGFFVGFMMEFIARIRPVIILSINTAKPWYIFTDRSPYAMIFAENLKAVRPDAMIIYAQTKEEQTTNKYICVPWTVEELLDRRGFLYDAHIMCMKENEMENFLDSVALADTTVPIICLANFTPAHHPMNISFFSLSDCTARIFWQQYPILKESEVILLIGFGNAGTVLLDRALQLNVFSDRQSIHYHIFGDSNEYRRNRKQLADVVSVNEESSDRDCVFFHKDLWNTDASLLARADRLILCADSEKENISILHTIQKFFAIKGELYIYNSNVRSVATPFGQTRDVLTPAFVLHNRLTDMALCRHELFRFMSGLNILMWEDLNSLSKDMNYIATDHISVKVRMMLGDEAPCKPFDELEPEVLRKAAAAFRDSNEEERERLRRIEHERNLRYYRLHNFHYGETVDDEARINPMLLPYEKLDDQQKMLTETAWMLLDELASHKEARRR
ncbi:MAG: ion transporter [Lachnospiraceae bacterium]|nr:ion transporter [Lachnospiraceae bacterium]